MILRHFSVAILLAWPYIPILVYKVDRMLRRPWLHSNKGLDYIHNRFISQSKVAYFCQPNNRIYRACFRRIFWETKKEWIKVMPEWIVLIWWIETKNFFKGKKNHYWNCGYAKICYVDKNLVKTEKSRCKSNEITLWSSYQKSRPFYKWKYFLYL